MDITSAVESGYIVTITTAFATNIQAGSQVVINNITGSGFAAYNGIFAVLDTPSATTFRYTDGTFGLSSFSSTGGLVYQDIQVPNGSTYGIPDHALCKWPACDRRDLHAYFL